MHVLVTGGAGFIASHIVDKLIEEGYEVAVVDNLSHGQEKNINYKARFYKCNIRNLDNLRLIFKLEKPEVIIHHAAQIDVETSIKSTPFDAKNNVIGTINVLECCKEYNTKKIIYSSSAAVYGNPKYLPVDEKHPAEPVSFYGISKYAAEYYIKIYSEIYGLKYAILRYSNVYGPRQDSKGESGVISIFLNKFLNGETPVIYGNGEQTRDFIYVKDIVCANLAALKNGDNEIFNISRNEPITINGLIDVLYKVFNKKIPPEYAPKRKGDIWNSYLDNSYAVSKLHWEPKYCLYDGIKETMEWSIGGNNIV